MFDLQTLIALLATLFLFLTSVVLAYDKLQFRNYDLLIPQWFGLLLAGITFGLLVADQILRGFVRLEERRRILEEEQRRVREENFRIEERERRIREEQRRIREEQRRISETRSRERETARAEADRIEERERRIREENFRIEEERRREREITRAENARIEERERQARRTGIETRYRIALIQYQLDPSAVCRGQLGDVLALLREYQDTL